jgi:hypothetical protein
MTSECLRRFTRPSPETLRLCARFTDFVGKKGDWGSQSWGNPDLEYLIIDPSMARARPARNGGSEDDRAFVRGVSTKISIAVAALGNRSAPS